VLPGITGHGIDAAVDTFEVLHVVEVEIEQGIQLVLSVYVVSTAAPGSVKIAWVGFWPDGGSVTVGDVIPKVEVSAKVFQEMEAVVELDISEAAEYR